MQNKRRLQKLLITSSVCDEGKSVIAVNLALSMARRPNERILLIEADLRRPTASSLLTKAKLNGISEWSEGKLVLEDALYQIAGLPLWFLPAGTPHSGPHAAAGVRSFCQDAGSGLCQLRLGAAGRYTHVAHGRLGLAGPPV